MAVYLPMTGRIKTWIPGPLSEPSSLGAGVTTEYSRVCAEGWTFACRVSFPVH